jgi:hypothetical protein
VHSRDRDQVVTPGEDTLRRGDASAAVCAQRQQPDMQRAVGAEPLDHRIRPGLLAQALAEQRQQQPEGRPIELAQLGQANRLTRGQAHAGGFKLTRFCGELACQEGLRLAAVAREKPG